MRTAERKTRLFALLTALWLVFIFLLSAQDATKSTVFSDAFTRLILNFLEPGEHTEEASLTETEAGFSEAAMPDASGSAGTSDAAQAFANNSNSDTYDPVPNRGCSRVLQNLCPQNGTFLHVLRLRHFGVMHHPFVLRKTAHPRLCIGLAVLHLLRGLRRVPSAVCAGTRRTAFGCLLGQCRCAYRRGYRFSCFVASKRLAKAQKTKPSQNDFLIVPRQKPTCRGCFCSSGFAYCTSFLRFFVGIYKYAFCARKFMQKKQLYAIIK